MDADLAINSMMWQNAGKVRRCWEFGRGGGFNMRLSTHSRDPSLPRRLVAVVISAANSPGCG